MEDGVIKRCLKTLSRCFHAWLNVLKKLKKKMASITGGMQLPPGMKMPSKRLISKGSFLPYRADQAFEKLERLGGGVMRTSPHAGAFDGGLTLSTWLQPQVGAAYGSFVTAIEKAAFSWLMLLAKQCQKLAIAMRVPYFLLEEDTCHICTQS